MVVYRPGRQEKANKLQTRIRMICRRHGEAACGSTDDAKFVRLQNELVRNTEKLFVFVMNPEVESTNNRSERAARGEALARKASRTSKTAFGAKRRGVIMSVLASLSKRLKDFTLDHVLKEINHWLENGRIDFPKRTRHAPCKTRRTFLTENIPNITELILPENGQIRISVLTKTRKSRTSDPVNGYNC